MQMDFNDNGAHLAISAMDVSELTRWCASQPSIPPGFWRGLEKANALGCQDAALPVLAAAFDLSGLPQAQRGARNQEEVLPLPAPRKRPQLDDSADDTKRPCDDIPAVGEYWSTETVSQYLPGHQTETSYFRVDKVLDYNNRRRKLKLEITWLYTIDQVNDVLEDELDEEDSLPDWPNDTSGYLTSTHRDLNMEIAIGSLTREYIKDEDIIGVFILDSPNRVILFPQSNRKTDVATQLLLRGNQTIKEAAKYVAAIKDSRHVSSTSQPARTGVCDLCKLTRTLTKRIEFGDTVLEVGRVCHKVLFATHSLLFSKSDSDWRAALGMYSAAIREA